MATRPVQPVVTGLIELDKLEPEIVMVVSLPMTGLVAVTELTVAGRALEPEPQAVTVNRPAARAASKADLVKILEIICAFIGVMGCELHALP